MTPMQHIGPVSDQSFWKNGAANSPTALEDINAFLKPHDGDAHHGPIHKTYKDHFQDAGFEVDVIKNQGAGAAMMRVEAARRVFPRCWFNESTSRTRGARLLSREKGRSVQEGGGSKAK
jgi:hypothetical protein